LFILVFKIIVALALGAYQFMLIKELLISKTHRYYLPPGAQDDSEDEME